MSAFAMFSLKDPSLLAFDARRNDENMKRLYGIGLIPSDTQLRAILDPQPPHDRNGEKFWDDGTEPMLALVTDHLCDTRPLDRFWANRPHRQTGLRSYHTAETAA